MYELVLKDGSRLFGTDRAARPTRRWCSARNPARRSPPAAPGDRLLEAGQGTHRATASSSAPTCTAAGCSLRPPAARSKGPGVGRRLRVHGARSSRWASPTTSRSAAARRWSSGSRTSTVRSGSRRRYRVIKTEKVQAAVGVLHVFDTSDGDSAGIGYGVGTFGSSDNAITAGAGIAYAGDSRGGIAMLGGERRVRRNLKLITENYIWQDGDGILSGGVRFIGERLSADLGAGDADRWEASSSRS